MESPEATSVGGLPPDSSGQEFEKNLETWSTPLDVYAVDTAKITYSGVLETQKCAAERGVHKEITDFIPEAVGMVNRSTFWVGIDTVENAEKWGFDPGGEARLGESPAQSWSTAEDDIWFACIDETNAGELTATSRANRLQAIADEANDRAEVSPEVVAAGERWLECIAPLGIAGLSSDPLSIRYAVAGGVTLPPGMDEKAVAIEDAKCKESSGYLEALYDAEIKEQLVTIEEHAEELESMLADKERLEAEADAIIQSHG